MDLDTDNTHAPETAPAPTARELFLGFWGLSMMAFGGALPLAHRMIVERKRWVSEAEFTELLGLCQFLPGGNIINLAVALGMRFRGVRGVIAALFGLLVIPSLIVILLSLFYQHYQNDPAIKHMFAGLAAAAAGLLIRMAVKLAVPLKGDMVKILMALSCFVAIAILRVPLLWTMLVLTPVSIWVCKRWARPASGKKGGRA